MVRYQWGVFWANLNPVKGSEQSRTRPVLVISAEETNQALPVVTVLAITSLKPGRKVYPIEVHLSKNDSQLNKDSIVMAHQIRTISKERIGQQCGFIESEKIRNRIKDAIKLYLDME